MYIKKILVAVICAVKFKADSVAVVLNAKKIFYRCCDRVRKLVYYDTVALASFASERYPGIVTGTSRT